VLAVNPEVKVMQFVPLASMPIVSPPWTGIRTPEKLGLLFAATARGPSVPTMRNWPAPALRATSSFAVPALVSVRVAQEVITPPPAGTVYGVMFGTTPVWKYAAPLQTAQA